MRPLLLTFLLTTLVVTPFPAALGQKKPPQCEQAPLTDRNWEVIDGAYVYFDYVLCPADMKPPSPTVRIWITSNGGGVAVEKWSQDRDGADIVSVFDGKKKAYTLYRDLHAVPITMLKSESRGGIADELAKQPFLAEGKTLAPLENLTPESADRVRKTFEAADGLVKKAAAKVSLLREATRIGVILRALKSPPKIQQ